MQTFNTAIIALILFNIYETLLLKFKKYNIELNSTTPNACRPTNVVHSNGTDLGRSINLFLFIFILYSHYNQVKLTIGYGYYNNSGQCLWIYNTDRFLEVTRIDSKTTSSNKYYC